MKLSDFKTLVIIGILLIYQSIMSQDVKKEKESSIKIEQFPGEIPARFHDLEIDLKREKLYKQEDGKEISYEMKFRHNRYDYSVEVDTIGRLLDIEIEIKEKKIPEGLIKEIEHYFNENYDRFKIEKIQAQFRNDNKQTTELIKKVIQKPLASPDSYEIIVAVKNDGNFKRFEYLFNTIGQVENKRKVIRNEFDYLIY